MRSVLIVCEEYPFLLSSYSWLRQDARVGRIEATTSEDEAIGLAGSYHPDVIVFDAAPVGDFGLGMVRRLRALNPNGDVVITMGGDHCPTGFETNARASGAVGVLSREHFSADACLKLAGVTAPATALDDEI